MACLSGEAALPVQHMPYFAGWPGYVRWQNVWLHEASAMTAFCGALVIAESSNIADG